MTTRDDLTNAQNDLAAATRKMWRAQEARDEMIRRGRAEGMSIGDLSKAMGVTRSRTHQLLTRLKKKGRGIDRGR